MFPYRTNVHRDGQKHPPHVHVVTVCLTSRLRRIQVRTSCRTVLHAHVQAQAARLTPRLRRILRTTGSIQVWSTDFQVSQSASTSCARAADLPPPNAGSPPAASRRNGVSQLSPAPRLVHVTARSRNASARSTLASGASKLPPARSSGSSAYSWNFMHRTEFLGVFRHVRAIFVSCRRMSARR